MAVAGLKQIERGLPRHAFAIHHVLGDPADGMRFRTETVGNECRFFSVRLR
jgi:hypothetical protein